MESVKRRFSNQLLAGVVMNDRLIALIRTGVLLAVGWLLTAISERTGFIIDEQTAGNVVAGFQLAATAIYYILIRVVAQWVPGIEWLLGIPSAPVYPKKA